MAGDVDGVLIAAPAEGDVGDHAGQLMLAVVCAGQLNAGGPARGLADRSIYISSTSLIRQQVSEAAG